MSGCLEGLIRSTAFFGLKSRRPIAAGRVSLKIALIWGCVLALIAGVVAYVVELRFFALVVLYFVLMLSYSFYLKNVLILDIFLVASAYLIRATAGAFIVDVTISPWLILCTLFLALFLIICKRRHELSVLGTNSQAFRHTLAGYSPQLLDQFISITTASTIIGYALYTLSPRTVSAFGTNNLIYTVPVVLFGVFRYLFLVYKNNQGGNPEILIWTDKPLLISIVVWVILLVVIIYSITSTNFVFLAKFF